MSVEDHPPDSPSSKVILESLFKERAERLERLRARAQALSEASWAFSEAAHSTDAALGVVARKTAELVGEACTISLVSDDRRTVRMVAFHHVDPAALEATRMLCPTLICRWAKASLAR